MKFSGNKEVGKTVRMDGLDTQSDKKNQIYILKILQYNAGFRIQTKSDSPITIIFRKRNTAEKEIFPYVFSHAKRKVREKTASFWGNIASFWKKTATFSTKHLYASRNVSLTFSDNNVIHLP